jgi:hypothetical protein
MSVLSTADEDKFLIDVEAERIGVVSDEQVAYVDPEPGIAERVVCGLGFGDGREDEVAIPGESIETVTDTKLRVAKTV